MQLPKMVTKTYVHVVVFSLFLLSGCSGINSSSSSVQTSGTQTTSPEKGSQPDHVPGTQAFMKYRSEQDAYELDIPQGWEREADETEVCFMDHFNGVEIVLTQASTAPTVESVRAHQTAELEKTGRSVRDIQVQRKQLSSSYAILITYTSDPESHEITSKQVRLENHRYLIFNNGKLVSLTLWAPLGTKNVNQWAHILNSFRWI